MAGLMRWRGAIPRQLWLLLRFNEAVQVGKGTAPGFGRYRLLGQSVSTRRRPESWSNLAGKHCRDSLPSFGLTERFL